MYGFPCAALYEQMIDVVSRKCVNEKVLCHPEDEGKTVRARKEEKRTGKRGRKKGREVI